MDEFPDWRPVARLELMVQKSLAFIFDLDGTLLDSVYQHIAALREAVERLGVKVPNWCLHRGIGASHNLLIRSLVRETGCDLSDKDAGRLRKYHGEAYLTRVGEVRPLPGAHELLETLSRNSIPWAMATSSTAAMANKALAMLSIDSKVPIITGDCVENGRPEPDLLLQAAERLGVHADQCLAVGDSIWDQLAARRARAIGVGLLSGGFGELELLSAGASVVYRDPLDLLNHLDELGVRVSEPPRQMFPVSFTPEDKPKAATHAGTSSRVENADLNSLS